MYCLKRIFHPVEQGAFYSEHFELENGQHFNVVYDCGSNQKNIGSVEIASSFKKSEDIDILFISHFHKDHTNLIDVLKNCCGKIKRVIIPLLENADFNILKIISSEQKPTTSESIDKIFFNVDYEQYIDNFKKIFGNETQIHEITPYNEKSPDKPNEIIINNESNPEHRSKKKQRNKVYQ